MDVLLGSTSPRRKEILSFFSLPFRTISPDFDEESIPFEGDPIAYVTALAVGKAESLINTHPKSILITADTVVCIDNTVLNKPKDEKELFSMLQNLSGRRHSVWTAVCASKNGKLFCQAEETKVYCNTLTPDELHRYVKKHSLHDKAGGYAIQKSGSVLVKAIEGCYYNVCGLPINTLVSVLRKVEIDLWDYLKDFQ